MKTPGPKNKPSAASSTLHLDSQHAWRQGQDAVVFPIIYEPAEEASLRIKTNSPQVNEEDFSLPELTASKLTESAQVEFPFPLEQPARPPAKRLSTSVPALLIGVLALVLFAWLTFR